MGRLSWIAVIPAGLVLAGCQQTATSAPPADGMLPSIIASISPGATYDRLEDSTVPLPPERAAPPEPLPAAAATTPAVRACRAAVEAQASKYGAREVEAAPAGPQKRLRGGGSFAPVRIRVTYQGPGGPEVRESSLICVTDGAGQIVDVYTPAE
jgi:hypothetical protein